MREVEVGSIPEIFRYNGCQSLAFDKVDSSSIKFIKEDTTAQVFSCEFSGVFTKTYFVDHIGLATFGNNCKDD